MKTPIKLNVIMPLIFLVLLYPLTLFAAGSSMSVSSDDVYRNKDTDGRLRIISIAFTADDTDGSIPDLLINSSATNIDKGSPLVWYLSQIKINCLSGVTPTQDSDLYIYEITNGQDLLRGKGVGEVDNTGAKIIDVGPIPIFTSGVTVEVTQATTATNSATGNIDIILTDGKNDSSEITKSIGSGELSSDTQIYTGPCYITAAIVRTNGTDNGQIILYDNTAASGTKIDDVTVIGLDYRGGRIWSFPRECENGIYLDVVSGTTPYAIIEYIPK